MNTLPENHAAVRLLTNHPDRFANQGAVVAAWRTYRGRPLGPYYRLAWRENGRQRSIYLGRQGPVVRQVRILLHQAHTDRRIRRQARLRTAQFRKEVIRPLKQYIEQMLALFGNGLYLKGSEIRGIRTAGPRLTAADVPKYLIPDFPLPLPSFLTDPATPPLPTAHHSNRNSPHLLTKTSPTSQNPNPRLRNSAHPLTKTFPTTGQSSEQFRPASNKSPQSPRLPRPDTRPPSRASRRCPQKPAHRPQPP